MSNSSVKRRYLSGGPIGQIWARRLRPIAVATLIVFGWSSAQPWHYAAALQMGPAVQASAAARDQERFDRALRALAAGFERLSQKLERNEPEIAADLEALDAPWADVADLAPDVQDELDRVGDHLRSAGVPQEIRQRHHDTVQAFAADLRRLEDDLKDARRLHGEFKDARDRRRSDEAAARYKDLGAKVRASRDHLRGKVAREKHQALDPNQLPHRGSHLQRREPRTRAEDFAALAAPAAEGLAAVATAPVLSLSARAAVPGPQDLAPTIDAPQTPEIQARAASLGNQPLRIFEWVRNNIDFTPTHGSIQGAQGCLQTRLCNDMDTASLLVALLRSAGVPARYAVGTVEVPIGPMKSWAGGFTDAGSALDFVASSGTPVVGLTDATGTLVAARVEHVWVEAFLDYIPSRAARPGASGDTWVPLDPSFKQIVVTDGLDLAAATDVDVENTFRDLLEGAAVADPSGAVTGIDVTAMEADLEAVRDDIRAYVADQSESQPEPVGANDMLPGRTIAPQTLSAAPASLPYRVTVRGAGFSTVPSGLRHTLRFEVYGDERFAFDPDFVFQASLPELAARKITLSYAPATAADETTLRSFLPASGNPSDLPASLPAYLVRVKPELRVEGVLKGSGGAVTLGQTGRFRMVFTQPGDGPRTVDNEVTAGTYNAVVLNLGRVEDAAARQARATAVRDRLQAGDLAGLGKDEIIGEMLYAAGLLYWSEIDLFSRAATGPKKVATSRLPSEGIFTYDLRVSYLFGTPRTVRSGSLVTDVDSDVQAVIARDGDARKPVDFLAVTGAFASRAESSIWDQTVNETPTGHGITAISYLESAVRQGIQLYHINRDNVAAALPKLQVSSAVKADIQSAVAAGKIVTIPQRELLKDGFTGVGYVVFDPATGAGGYLISGGLAGGGFQLPPLHPLLNFLLGVLLVGAGIFASGALAVALAIAGIALIAYDFISTVQNLPNMSPEAQEMVIAFLAMLALVGILLAIIGIFFGSFLGFVVFAVYWAFLSIMASNILITLVQLMESRTNLPLTAWMRERLRRLREALDAAAATPAAV
jgi:transglutaminase-like putative cysteine protease